MFNYDYPVLFRCPFCRDDDAPIYLDVEHCVIARSEDSDSRYFHGDRLADGQNLIRFGPKDHQGGPCPHLFRAEGIVRLEDQNHSTTTNDDDDDDDNDEEPNEWTIEFDWMPPEIHCLADGVIPLYSPGHLPGFLAGLDPIADFVCEQRTFRWDALKPYRNLKAIYHIDSTFIAVHDLKRVRTEIAIQLNRRTAASSRPRRQQ